MAKWTVEYDKGAGPVAIRYLDQEFELGLNQLGSFRVRAPQSASAINEGDTIIITWDKGGPAAREWFRGQVGTKTADQLTGNLDLRGYGEAYVLYSNVLGDLRDYGAVTPYTVLTTGAPPYSVRHKSNHTSIIAYGTTAPNAITGANQGDAFVPNAGDTVGFRAHTTRLLTALNRLCEQSSYGGGASFGLEWFVNRIAGVLTLNVVTRRQRAGVYTPDTFQTGANLFVVPKATDTEGSYNRVKVIGEGSGYNRTESSWYSSGAADKEYIFTDKTVRSTDTANRLAQRILAALNTGANPRFMAKTHKHGFATDVGDDVHVTPQGGGAPTTYRCLGVSYSSKTRAFTLELGRTRRFFATQMRDVDRALDALDIHSQETDYAPVFLQPSSTALTNGADTTVNAGDTGTLVASATPPTDFGKCDSIWFDIEFKINAGTAAAADSHTHDMQNHTHAGPSHAHSIDVTGGLPETAGVDVVNTGRGVLGKGGAGNFSQATGASGTGNTSGPSNNTTSAASSTGVTIMGPFVLHIVFVDSGGAEYEIAAIPLWYLVIGATLRVTKTYPFGWKKAGSTDFTPATLKLKVANQGSTAITVDHAATSVTCYPRALTRLNTGLDYTA